MGDKFYHRPRDRSSIRARGGGGSGTSPVFQVGFADLGSGQVSLTQTIGAGTPAFTRATVANTYGSNGLIVQVASGTPRSYYNPVSLVYEGYLAEMQATQLIVTLASVRDMTNAAWVKTTMTTAFTSTGADGAANKATRCTATAGNATILQTLTAAATSRTYSCLMKRVTGTGQILIQQGATTLDVTASINSSTFTQVQLNASILNSAFGIKIVTNGDAIDVDFNQFEAGAEATTPIPDSINVRNQDQLLYTSAPNIDNAGTIITTVYPETGFANSIANTVVYSNGDLCGYARVIGATSLRLFDGTNTIDQAWTPARSSKNKVAACWPSSPLKMETVINATVGTPGTFDGAMNFSGSYAIGYHPSFTTRTLGGCIGALAFYPSRLSDTVLKSLTT